jgi:hypothetical protein
VGGFDRKGRGVRAACIPYVTCEGSGGDCTFPISLALYIARILTNPTTFFLRSFSACAPGTCGKLGPTVSHSVAIESVTNTFRPSWLVSDPSPPNVEGMWVSQRCERRQEGRHEEASGAG